MDFIQLNAAIEVPEGDVSPILLEEGEYLYRLLKEKNWKNTLETGFANGRSAAHIIAATQSKHIAIDPYQTKSYDKRGLKNIEKLGYSKYLEFHEDYAHYALPTILKQRGEGSFDMIFIDGNHRFDGAFIDWYYADLLIKQGGYVIIQDIWMPSLMYLMSWVETNREDYNKVPVDLKNIVVYEKIGKDLRKWHHFKEFAADTAEASARVSEQWGDGLRESKGKKGWWKKIIS